MYGFVREGWVVKALLITLCLRILLRQQKWGCGGVEPETAGAETPRKGCTLLGRVRQLLEGYTLLGLRLARPGVLFAAYADVALATCCCELQREDRMCRRILSTELGRLMSK